jgi:sugar/nucleoside kinase (ribokinase family)
MDSPFIIAGRLQRDYILPLQGRPLLDAPGGSPLYAAIGMEVWKKGTGLLARVGEDYPHEWLRTFEKHGLDTRGIRILTETLDLRNFEAWLGPQTVQRNNPVAHFSRLHLSFPKSLLGYQPPIDTDDDRKTARPVAPRPADIPPEYLKARGFHCCPLDYLSTSRLLSAFREAGVTFLTLDPSAGYMVGSALEDLRGLIHGLTAFLPSEEELRALFWGRTDDLWKMAEELGSYGCELIVIMCGPRGQLLYDSVSKKRWEIPAYPARLADPSGAGASFSGGFLAGYQNTYDPLRAVLHGSVSASLTVEGNGAFHALDALPGLAQARLDSLTGMVRQI